MNKRNKQKAYQLGLIAERLTIVSYWLRGYHVLERRYKTKVGEVDVIMIRGSLIVFIEVKARKDKTATELITTQQQQRIVRAAQLYIAKHPKLANLSQRCDVVVYYPPWRLKRYKNAW